MINPQWLKLPMFRINFDGPKDVRVIKVFTVIWTKCDIHKFYVSIHKQTEKGRLNLHIFNELPQAKVNVMYKCEQTMT